MSYVVSQFGNPRGIFGQLIGLAMAIKNRQRNNWMISLLDIQPSDYILEIGFGPGVAIEEISKLAVKGFVAGIDHSKTMVQQASRRNAAAISQGLVELKHGSVSNLPYADNSFDQAISSNSHFFWSDPVESFKEVRRVLKPGEKIAICWQPRWAKTEATIKESVDKTVAQLSAAGFTQLRLEFKPMKPVTGICALGIKQSEVSNSLIGSTQAQTQ